MVAFKPSSILVPTDLSAAAANSVRVARSIAADDGDVTVAFVGLDRELVAPGHIWGMDAIAQENVAVLEQRLRDWISENELGDVRPVLRYGDPGMEICALASEQKVPLVIVPSHGRTGVRRILLGSVAERIIRHCDCSVLVLRRTDDDEQPISADWLPRRHVIVPVDLSEATGIAIESALKTIDDPEHLEIIHVVGTVDDAMMAGAMVISPDELQESRTETLERYLADRGWGHLKHQVLIGDTGLTITEHATANQADLIVMPSHGFHGFNRLLLGSTTERVLRHSSAPVLVLRRHDAV